MAKQPAVSFEFFPPGDDAMAEQLWNAVRRLEPLQPNFVSVTYGADGSTRTRTHDCVLRILRETNLRVAPHLTCVGASQDELLDIAKDYWQQGVRHMVALRGDLPGGAAVPQLPGYRYASDLVRGLASAAPFEISVAAYPEGHPESGGVEADLDNLRTQDRRRRKPRDHPILFRHRRFSALSRPVFGIRHPDRYRSGDPAHHAFSSIAEVRGPVRRLRARVAAPPVRRPRRRCGNAAHDRSPRGDRPGAPPPGKRHRGIPFLHPQSRRAHLCHLPRDGAAPGAPAAQAQVA